MAIAGLVVAALLLGLAVLFCPRRLELGGTLLALFISTTGAMVEGVAFGLTLGALVVVAVAVMRSVADTSNALREPRRERVAERRRRERLRQRDERVRRLADRRVQPDQKRRAA